MVNQPPRDCTCIHTMLESSAYEQIFHGASSHCGICSSIIEQHRSSRLLSNKGRTTLQVEHFLLTSHMSVSVTTVFCIIATGSIPTTVTLSNYELHPSLSLSVLPSSSSLHGACFRNLHRLAQWQRVLDGRDTRTHHDIAARWTSPPDTAVGHRSAAGCGGRPLQQVSDITTLTGVKLTTFRIVLYTCVLSDL